MTTDRTVRMTPARRSYTNFLLYSSFVLYRFESNPLRFEIMKTDRAKHDNHNTTTNNNNNNNENTNSSNKIKLY